MTPCLAPLAPWRKDVHVLSGLDNAAASGKGNGHTNSMSGLMTGTDFTGRGPSGPSIDQIIAGKIGGDSRFRSLQIGVAQESFGESMQRNMSWAGYERALPPEMIPHRLFDRLFGAQEEGWVNRKRSILDTVLAGCHRARRRSCRTTTRRAWTSICPASAIWSAPSPACRPSTAASIRPISMAT